MFLLILKGFFLLQISEGAQAPSPAGGSFFNFGNFGDFGNLPGTPLAPSRRQNQRFWSPYQRGHGSWELYEGPQSVGVAGRFGFPLFARRSCSGEFRRRRSRQNSLTISENEANSNRKIVLRHQDFSSHSMVASSCFPCHPPLNHSNGPDHLIFCRASTIC